MRPLNLGKAVPKPRRARAPGAPTVSTPLQPGAICACQGGTSPQSPGYSVGRPCGGCRRRQCGRCERQPIMTRSAPWLRCNQGAFLCTHRGSGVTVRRCRLPDGNERRSCAPWPCARREIAYPARLRRNHSNSPHDHTLGLWRLSGVDDLPMLQRAGPRDIRRLRQNRLQALSSCSISVAMWRCEGSCALGNREDREAHAAGTLLQAEGNVVADVSSPLRPSRCSVECWAYACSRETRAPESVILSLGRTRELMRQLEASHVSMSRMNLIPRRRDLRGDYQSYGIDVGHSNQKGAKEIRCVRLFPS
jgi:hypothetical protein